MTWQVVEREAQDHDPSCNFYKTLSASIFKQWKRREEYSNCKCLEYNEGLSNRTTGFVKTKLCQTSLFSPWIVDKGKSRTCCTLNILQQSHMPQGNTGYSYCYTMAQKQQKKQILRIISSSSQRKWKAILNSFVLLLVLIINFFRTWLME